MKNGLTPKTQFLFILLLGLIGFVFLITRPKTVVSNEDKAVASTSTEESQGSSEHNANPEAANLATEIRKKYAGDANPLNAYRELGEMFYRTSVFDSAAYYYEQIAISSPGVETWLRAGDMYLQANTLALNGAKMEELAEKARKSYTNVLKLDPANLHAKTNTALTFVNSQTPMRAISILREVVEAQPNYVPAILAMGKLSMQSGQFDKAVERFKEVLSIDKNNLDGKIGLAYSYIELDKTDDAKVLLNEVVNEDIDPIIKDEVRKTLNNIK